MSHRAESWEEGGRRGPYLEEVITGNWSTRFTHPHLEPGERWSHTLPGLCKLREGVLGVFSLSLAGPTPWGFQDNSAVCPESPHRLCVLQEVSEPLRIWLLV